MMIGMHLSFQRTLGYNAGAFYLHGGRAANVSYMNNRHDQLLQ